MQNTHSVDGALLKWAREQQGLTLRAVVELGGPSIGFQSEVENGRKTEVSVRVLHTWAKILGITEAFAKGQLSRYNEEPAACRGMAADVLCQIPVGSNWIDLSPFERVRSVINLIATRSIKAPRVVLAYVLGIELQTLDRMLHDSFVIPPWMINAASDLTTLSEESFGWYSSEVSGSEDKFGSYYYVVNRAVQLGISPSDLLDLLEETAWLRK